MRSTLPVLVLLSTISLVTAPVLAQNGATLPEAKKKPGDPTSVDVLITMTSPTEATLHMEQVWEGPKAPAFRQSLDAYFGNGDKNLSATESELIATASERDIVGMPLPWLVVDGQAVAVTDAVVTLENYGPQTPLGAPLRMIHDASLEMSPSDGESRRIAVDPLWDAHVTVVGPDGWVASAPGGVGGAQSVDADVKRGGGLLVTVSSQPLEPAPLEEGTEEGPAESLHEPPPPQSAIPGPGSALAALAIAAAGLLAARLRRR